MMLPRSTVLAALLATLLAFPASADECVPVRAGRELPGPSIGGKGGCGDRAGECSYVVQGTEIGVSDGLVVRKETRATDPALRLPFGQRGGIALADFVFAYAGHNAAPTLWIGGEGRQIIVSTDLCLLSAAGDIYELTFEFNSAGMLTSVVERISHP